MAREVSRVSVRQAAPHVVSNVFFIKDKLLSLMIRERKLPIANC